MIILVDVCPTVYLKEP